MGQQRVSNIALINIERKYANSVVNNDIDRTKDILCRSMLVHRMTLVSFRLLRKNLDNWREIGKKIARTHMWPQFSDFARFLCALPLRLQFEEQKS